MARDERNSYEADYLRDPNYTALLEASRARARCGGWKTLALRHYAEAADPNLSGRARQIANRELDRALDEMCRAVIFHDRNATRETMRAVVAREWQMAAKPAREPARTAPLMERRREPAFA